MIYLDFIRWWNKYTSASVCWACVRLCSQQIRKEGRNEDGEKQQQQQIPKREWMNGIEFDVIEMEWLATAFFCSFIFELNVIIFQF